MCGMHGIIDLKWSAKADTMSNVNRVAKLKALIFLIILIYNNNNWTCFN